MNKPEFRSELEKLINRTSMENGSNTPDFILAEFLVGCLAAYDHATKTRDAWMGNGPRVASVLSAENTPPSTFP